MNIYVGNSQTPLNVPELEARGVEFDNLYFRLCRSSLNDAVKEEVLLEDCVPAEQIAAQNAVVENGGVRDGNLYLRAYLRCSVVVPK